jgi:hypothetical protein
MMIVRRGSHDCRHVDMQQASACAEGENKHVYGWHHLPSDTALVFYPGASPPPPPPHPQTQTPAIQQVVGYYLYILDLWLCHLLW